MFKFLKNKAEKYFFDRFFFLNFFFSITFSLILFYLSLDQSLWFKFWSSLSIPPQPAFSDLKAHIYFYNCFKNGIDIFTTGCPLIPQGNAAITTHPKIWLYLVKILNLSNEKIYNVFVIVSLIIYFYFIFRLFKVFKTYPIIIFRIKILQFFLIFIVTILKYYPIFLLCLFLERKKVFLISFLSIFTFLILFYTDEITNVNENLIEIALFTAYGSRTMLKALFHLSENYNFFLDTNNLNFFRNFTFILFFIFSFFLIIIGYMKAKLPTSNNLDRFESFFLLGASIYTGTFIIGANVDYRLIFLIFTIPYVLDIKNITIKYCLIFSYIISINSFLFQSGDPLSAGFFMKAILVFGCKFLIFSTLLIMIGSILKKISLFKFKLANV